MMPQLTPIRSISTRWHRRAMSAGSQAKPPAAWNARATASENEADEDSPAPTGTSVPTTPLKPDSFPPRRTSCFAVPLAYSPQAGPPRARSESENSDASVKSSECRATAPSALGLSAIHVARSMASGRTKPSL